MAKKLNLPPQLLEKIGGSDDSQWRESHNFGGKRKSRKETRKEARNLKKQKPNHSGINNQREPKALPKARNQADKKPKKPVKDTRHNEKPKLKSDVYLKPFLSAHEEEMRKKDTEDAEYYAKKLGLKSLKLNDEGDGWDDLLGDLDFDETKESQEPEDILSPSEVDEGLNVYDDGSDVEMLSDSDNDDDDGVLSDLDDTMTAGETMAKLAALKKNKSAQVESKATNNKESDGLTGFDDSEDNILGLSDDELDENDFDSESDQDEEEMTAEETMAKLAALKKSRTNDIRVVKEEDLKDDDDVSDMSEFSGDDDDGFNSDNSSDTTMTAEETMARLAALKRAKVKESGKPDADEEVSDAFSGDNSDSDSDTDGESNPYVPPTRRSAVVAPSSTQLSENMIKAQRKFKSALNKLTESTLPHVSSEINLEFLQNSRTESSEVFTDLLLELVGGPQSLQHTMYTVYAGLVAAIYQTQGVDFGGVLLQKLVPEILKSNNPNATNLLSLLVELYTLHVVGSRLMYDLITRFLNDLSGKNEEPVEKLLIIIRDSGSMLRSDDPTALKRTILLVQQRMHQLSSSGAATARARFMMDSIIALKNNRQKPVSELVVSLRHRIRTSKLLSPQGSASTRREPMQVDLSDITESDTRGKWWLVGASWKGHRTEDSTDNNNALTIDLDNELGAETTDWLELARKQRLNTTVRRAVFVALMGAEDYLDACLRIDKLSLKNRQERDIPHVILHCLTQEPVYNPFYALVAGKQCVKHSLMKTFQFRLWDWLSETSESRSQASPEAMQTSMQFARFYASLVLQRCMTLDILKAADFLGGQHQVFLEVFLVTLYRDLAREAETVAKKNTLRRGVQLLADGSRDVERDGKELTAMLTKIKDPKVLRGLQLYHVAVVNSEAIRGKKDRSRVSWAADLVAGVIDELVHRQRDE